MGWFDSRERPKLKNHKKSPNQAPSGLWKKCTACGEILQATKLHANANVCPYCDHHFRMSAKERLKTLVDDGSFVSFGREITTTNPLEFVDKVPYGERLSAAQKKTGLTDTVVAGIGKIEDVPVSICIMDFYFMGGSMGVVAGEMVAHTFDVSLDQKIPAIVISCSGGARMQEGIISLMQMAKTSAGRSRLKKARIPFFSVLTDPTTGGVAASFAMQGDVNIAEPKALIGFAGPRVIEQSIRQKLPEGFQRSEFLLKHGFIDRIVHRKDLRQELSFFAKFFSTEGESTPAQDF